MELRQLRYFLQLYDDRNFAVAASKLYLTQQALSKAILNLEIELGVPLFLRDAPGVTPTEYGDYLDNVVRPAVRSIDSVYHQLKEMQRSRRFTVHLGCTGGINHVITKIIVEFEKLHPEIRICETTMTDRGCEKSLQEQTSDLICITEPCDPDLPYDYMPIFRDDRPFVIYSQNSPLADHFTLEALADHVLLDHGDDFYAALRLRKIFEKAGLQYFPAMESVDHASMLPMIQTFGYASVCPGFAVKYYISSELGILAKEFPLDNHEAPLVFCLALRKGEHPVREVSIFANFLKTEGTKYIAPLLGDLNQP